MELSHVILEEFASFYISLYSDEEMDCSKRFDVLRKFSKKIPLDSTNALDEEITLIEIQTAIRKLKTNASTSLNSESEATTNPPIDK